MFFLSAIVFSKVLLSAGVRAAGRGAKVSFSGPERIKNTTTLLRFPGQGPFCPFFHRQIRRFQLLICQLHILKLNR